MSNPPPILEPARGAPILDYAGPASRGKFRLPAKSQLSVRREIDYLRIHETLAGQVEAGFAIVFAIVTLVIVVISGSDPIVKHQIKKHLFDVVLFYGIAAAELITLLAVIENTWRTTTLTLTADAIRLRFSSPFKRAKLHHWPAEKFRGVYLNAVRLQTGGPEFAQLELDLWGEPQVHLFLGHPPNEIRDLIRFIHELHAPAPPVDPPPLPPNASVGALKRVKQHP